MTVFAEMGEYQYLEGYATNSSSCNDKWQIPVFVRKMSELQCLEGYDPKSSYETIRSEFQRLKEQGANSNV